MFAYDLARHLHGGEVVSDGDLGDFQFVRQGGDPEFLLLFEHLEDPLVPLCLRQYSSCLQ